MTFANPVLNKNNTILEILLTTDNNRYTYGEPYETEVLLDGNWYKVPFAGGAFNLPAYGVGPNAVNEKAVCSCNPVMQCGVLPAGQYRIIKDFEIRYDPPEGMVEVLAKDFVTAELIVEEPLGSEDAYIDIFNQ
jgi:hypothetical protein